MAWKFKAGDRVRFLNDVGGGKVIRVESNGQVYVQTEDGFEIPVPAKELVMSGSFAVAEKDEPASAGMKSVQTEKKPAPLPKTQAAPVVASLPRNIALDAEISLLLGFVPESQGPVFSSRIMCYLINDSAFHAYYVLGTFERGGFYHLASGMAEADTKNFIFSFDQTSLSKISGIHVQLILLSDGRYQRKSPVDKIVDIGLVNFSKESYFRENEYFEEKAIIFPVAGTGVTGETPDHFEITDTVKAQKTAGENVEPAAEKKKEVQPDTLEIDLHMDEADIQQSQFSLSGILALQMTRFHAAMEEAISKNMKRIVIIHGVGQGTLKMQIRKELQEKYPGYIFQDASFREYGFGATLVHLSGNKKQ
jgi:hypothetical protein